MKGVGISSGACEGEPGAYGCLKRVTRKVIIVVY
jgi:hypothetical protein